jgi:hypothetical protein
LQFRGNTTGWYYDPSSGILNMTTTLIDSGATQFVAYLLSVVSTFIPPSPTAFFVNINAMELPVIPLPDVPYADSTGMVRNFDCCPSKRLRG